MHQPGEHLAGCGCRTCLAVQSLAEKLLYQWPYVVALEQSAQDEDIARAAVAAASLDAAQPGPSIHRAGGVAGQREGRYKAMKRRKDSGGCTAVSVLTWLKPWAWPAWNCEICAERRPGSWHGSPIGSSFSAGWRRGADPRGATGPVGGTLDSPRHHGYTAAAQWHHDWLAWRIQVEG